MLRSLDHALSDRAFQLCSRGPTGGVLAALVDRGHDVVRPLVDAPRE